ncbi:hypothetical protein [Stenotrophomonas pavanii]|uniref:hypothetical protein n=2 Tax=Stenotrophomonas TaxID=40323 RepID=UPI0024783DDD|nr:hypothetical protein [Stenotrophomonas pavanii]WGS57354.1 hypothetical protein IAI57_00860 [Stenotrophomonas pavanii]
MNFAFSPATQALLVHTLINGRSHCNAYSALRELANPLKQLALFTQEFTLAGVAAVKPIGLRAHVQLDECGVTWSAVESSLTTPIVNVLVVLPRDLARSARGKYLARGPFLGRHPANAILCGASRSISD